MNIIELAKEAGLPCQHPDWIEGYERFAALVRAEVEAEWIETNKALAKEIIVKTEALKLAEEALKEAKHALENGCKWIEPKWDDEWRVGRGAWMVADKAIAAIREALSDPDIEEMTLTQIAARHEPVKQEPVAWMLDISDSERVRIHLVPYKMDGYTPLYTSPIQAVSEPVTFPANGLLQQEPFRSIPTSSQNEESIQPFAYYCDEFSADGRLIDREYNGINQFSAGRFGKPLYAAPIDAKAIRAESLEEAAKVCDSVNNYDNPMTATDCAAAIRGLK